MAGIVGIVSRPWYALPVVLILGGGQLALCLTLLFYLSRWTVQFIVMRAPVRGTAAVALILITLLFALTKLQIYRHPVWNAPWTDLIGLKKMPKIK